MNILCVANPFRDQAVCVRDNFLSENNFTKGISQIAPTKEKVVEVWKKSGGRGDPFLVGGSGTNVAKVLARLGSNVALCGRVGNCEDGRKIEKEIKKIGMISLLTKGEQKNGVVNCFVSPDGERTMQSYFGASSEFSQSDLRKEHFTNKGHVHIEGYMAYFGSALNQSTQGAKEKNATLSIDLASTSVVTDFKEKFSVVLPKMDYIFGNAEEYCAYTEISDLKQAAESFSKGQTIILTDGANGCWVKGKGETQATHFDAQTVSKVVDTTGAGDFFAGGFLHAALQGKNTSECVQLGNTTASHVIQHLGAELPEKVWKAL